MSLVVTGLSQNGDVTALKAALGAVGMPLDPLQVIGPDSSGESMARGLAGSELYVSEGGTGVPGLNHTHGATGFFRNESISDRLGDLEIPDSEIDNYLEALERGRSVIAYFAHAETIDKVEEAFRNASLLNIRRF